MSKIILPKSNHELGYTKKEIKQICKNLKISYFKVIEMMGIGTRAVDEKTNEILAYKHDVLIAIKCVLEKRKLKPIEWD